MACGICKAPDHNRRTCKLNPDYDHELGRVPCSEKLLIAARRNAKLGGRPVEHACFDAFEKFPSPPDDELERNAWVQSILAKCLDLQIRGVGSERMNDQVRKLAHAIAELTPKERLWKAEQLIRGDSIRKKPKSRTNGTQPVRPGSKPLQ